MYDEEHGDQLKRAEELVLKEFEDSLLQVCASGWLLDWVGMWKSFLVKELLEDVFVVTQ